MNDARAMSDPLQQLGFTVMVAENQDRRTFAPTQHVAAGREAAEPGGPRRSTLRSRDRCAREDANMIALSS